MTQKQSAFKLSPLSKVLIPLLSGAILVGCNSDNSNSGTTPSVPGEGIPSVPSDPTEPKPVELPPVVAVPADEGIPAANQVFLSYIDSAPSTQSTAAMNSDSWLLKCADNSTISPSLTDNFGPMWTLLDSQISSCGTMTIVKNGSDVVSGFSVEAGDLGKGFYVDASGKKSEGTRQDALMESKGLSQKDTNITLPAVKAPEELPAPPAGSIALQLYDPMGDYAPYDNFSLHLWGTVDKPESGCSGLASASANDGWDDKSVTPAHTDEYGPVWHLPVASTEEGCFNVIFRNDNNDKLIGADIKVDIATTGATNSITFMPGSTTQYTSRAQAFALAGPSSEFKIDTIGAILLDNETMVWQGGKNADMVQIMFSNDGQYKVRKSQVEGQIQSTVSGMSIVLSSAELTPEQQEKYPHLASYSAFSIPSLPNGMELSRLVKRSLIAISSNSDRTMRSSTGIQTAGALDAIFAEEATQLDYGPLYENNEVTLRLWAPTASSVNVVIYNSNKEVISTESMSEDLESGSWSVRLPSDNIDGKYYRYEMSVYQPREQQAYQFEVTDPYSVSLSTNSEYSQAIDLESQDLKPNGWDSVEAPHSQLGDDLANMVIYESHVRDFSARDESTEHKGKYLAFTEQGTVPVDHLKALREAGMTHLHLMPVFDIATINEDPSKVADIDQPFSRLCDLNPSVKQSQFAKYCSGGGTIADAFEELKQSDTKETPVVEALNEYVRGVDSYNWGYDPFHYTVPEGSYATNAEGSQRILEFREMVKSVKQDIGMNVVVDVVYNHTNASGLTSKKSVLDKIVPLYYHRLVADTGAVETSTCCDNTAPEHAMFAKLIDDSIRTWTEQYKIDAFRWDLMGHHPLAQMKGTLDAAREINPEVYFYGEGWNFGEVQDDKRFIQATQKHLGGTGIGSFSDRLRDAVRGGSPFESGDDIRKAQGFATGAYVAPNELVNVTLDENDDGVSDELARALHQSDLIRLGMAGNLKSFELVDFEGTTQTGATLDYNGQAAGYAEQPWEVQNYVSKHDNQTFWDINMYKVDHDITTDERVRMQAVGMATVLLGQAMPFKHMGGELLRSKSMQRDSYDYGDWYNLVDFTREDNNWNKGLPAKNKDQANFELIEKVTTTNAQPSASHIEQMFEFYKELLSVRKATPLLTLPNADEIVSRVDFRNTGPLQQAGLIVMTVDNGSSQATDIDSRYDSAVVVINATPETQKASTFLDGNGDPIELGNFELIASHASSNSIAQGALYSSNEFSVPAWSAAVFVEPREQERGLGLPVSSKEDVPPFGANQEVYIAGDFNGWTVDGTVAPYQGNGIYSQVVGASNSSGFKFTLGDWDNSFGCGGDNCATDDTLFGMYRLEMDANDTANPIVTSELVEDYTEVTWYMPGDALGWSHDDAQKMSKESDAIWSATLTGLTADTKVGFKFTGGDWGVFEHSSQNVVLEDSRFTGDNNIEFTPDEDGTYKISFNILTKHVTAEKQ